MNRRSFVQRLALGGLAVAFGGKAVKTFNNNEAAEQVQAILAATEQSFVRGGNPDTVIWSTDFGPLVVLDSRSKIAEQVVQGAVYGPPYRKFPMGDRYEPNTTPPARA
jgi:hypothetical protein